MNEGYVLGIYSVLCFPKYLKDDHVHLIGTGGRGEITPKARVYYYFQTKAGVLARTLCYLYGCARVI